MIKEIAFTVYPAANLADSRRFYEETLGLKVSSSGCEGRWVEYDVAGQTFAITDLNPNAAPGKGAGVAFEVDDLEKTLGALKAASVPVVEEPFDTPVCRMAVVADPAGNEIIIHKRK